jgi:hypothetical protein
MLAISRGAAASFVRCSFLLPRRIDCEKLSEPLLNELQWQDNWSSSAWQDLRTPFAPDNDRKQVATNERRCGGGRSLSRDVSILRGVG